MQMRDEFEGKVVIVTGSGQGLGRAIATAFANNGAKVVIADFNAEAGEKTATELKELSGEALFVKTDVTSQDSVNAMVQTTLDTYEAIDVLVNNAGRTGFHQGNPLTQTDETDWDTAFKVNLRGTFFCTKAVYNLFKDQGRGKIINIASQAGKYGDGSLPHYSASKAGILNLTQSTAKELAPFNINVNAVCPGYIFTPMWEGLKAYAESMGITTHEFFAAYCKKIVPMQREQYPEDIANAVMFFASEAARNITSQAINVDGGTREH